MVGTVEQIRKDLAALEAATATLAEEFKKLYDNYLEALGKAARRQLILASYHLCTQAYPDAFLRLSLGQRQKLQEALRALGDQVQNRLTTLPESGLESFQQALMLADSQRALPEGEEEAQVDPDAADLPPPATTLAGVEPIESLEQPQASQPEAAEGEKQGEDSAGDGDSGNKASFEADPAFEEDDDSEDNDSEDDDDSEDGPFPDMPMVRAMLMNAVLEAIDPDLSEAEEDDQPLTPARLLKRHFLLEQRIRMVLQRMSNGANRLLQKAEMLPALPDAVLAAATEADIPLEKSASAPNLLNVLVEMAQEGQASAGDDQNGSDAAEEEESDAAEEEEFEEIDGSEDEATRNVTHLVAIHLRLSDIEFADPQASLWRSKLREALGKLKQMANRYQKKQRERAIAEAELAWRSTWYDDTTQG